MDKLRILIADDSLIILKKLTQVFEGMGHTVVKTVRTGREVVENYSPQTVDLVSMDITMPDMDGIEATAKIKEINPDAKVMVVTSHGQEQMIVKAIDAGAVGYILKPFDKDKIANMIDKILKGDTDS